LGKCPPDIKKDWVETQKKDLEKKKNDLIDFIRENIEDKDEAQKLINLIEGI